MSGEYDDLLAAFNIPTLQSPTKDGAKVQAKPKPISVSTAADVKPLLSPKKLALNGNASTTEEPEVDDEEEEGWIIDEGTSTTKEGQPTTAKEGTDPKPADGVKTLPPDRQDQLNNGEMTNGKEEENGGEKVKGRRKQIFPKLNVPSVPAISTSLTPMQGWMTSKNPPVKVTASDANMNSVNISTSSPSKGTVTIVPSNSNPVMGLSIPGCARTPQMQTKTFRSIIPVSLQKHPSSEVVITASPSKSHLSRGSEGFGPANLDKIVVPVTTISNFPVVKQGRDTGGTHSIKAALTMNSVASDPQSAFIKSCVSPSSVALLLDPTKEIAKKYEPAVPLSEYKKYNAPPSGFSCRVCSCTFLFKSGLLAHFKRPSLDISLKCDVCAHQKVFRFYNKCALWTHLMFHKRHTVAHLKNLMKAITVQPLSQKEFQAYNFGVYCQMTLEDFEKPGCGKQSSPQIPRDGRCPGCTQDLSNESKKIASDSMKLHLGSLDPANMAECSICQRLVRNRCEMELHKVFHKKGKHCPGCASYLPNTEAYFQHASSGSCIYWLSAPMFICEFCKLCYFSVQAYVEHLCARHFLSYYKCSRCQLAFRNPVTLNKHVTKDHHLPNSMKMAQLDRQRIYKCLLCKNVFSGPAAMQSHLLDSHKSHIMGQIEKYVHVCPLCRNSSNWFSEETMKYHMFGIHRTKTFPVVCDRCGKIVSSLESLLAHKSSCPRRSGGPPVPKRPTGDLPKGVTAALAATTKRVLRCPMCPASSKVFYSAEAVYLCHFQVAHKNERIIPKPQWVDLITTNTKSTPTGIGVAVDRQDSNNKEKAVTSNKPTKVLQSTTPSAASKSKAHTSTSPPKRPLENDGGEVKTKKVKVIRRTPLTCSKCQFTSNDRDQFQEHIKEHKENPSHHQCQECGLCFRSQMAVTRHLAMQHRIQTPVAPAVLPVSSPVVRSPVKPKFKPIIPKEVTPPVKEKDPEPTPTAISPKAKSPPEDAEMECTVCYRKFTTDTLLRNHMRTHGMAFIRSKRTSASKLEPVE